MFGAESCLNGLFKLAHGTKNLGQQIAYWYVIDRSIHSISIKHQPPIDQYPRFIDGYINENVISKYKQQFDHTFLTKFSSHADNSIIFRSRYKTRMIVYHSLSYSLCK